MEQKVILTGIIFLLGIEYSSEECKETNITIQRDKRDDEDYYYKWREDEDYIEEEISHEIIINTTVVCTNVHDPAKDVVIGTIGNTTDLKIQNSTINTIQASAFQNTKEIVKLELVGLQIEKIISGAFNGLSTLKSLSLQNNSLTINEDGVFDPLSNLEILILSENKLLSLNSKAFTGLNALKVLILSGNQLSILEEAFFAILPKLEELDLSNNKISSFKSSVFSSLSNLKSLHLHNNSAVLFPDIANLDSLHYINAANNSLTEVDLTKNISFFSSKIDIILSFNNINSIKNLHCIKTIGKLDVSYNNFQELLRLDESTIHNIDHVNFSHNLISRLEADTFANLEAITSLDLSFNKIFHLPNGVFNKMDDLVYLDLSHNRIQHLEFGVLQGLRNVRIFDVSYNNISVLHAGQIYAFMSMIEELYLAHNSISSLEVGHSLFWKLKKLSLDKNNLKCDDLLTFVRDYFRSPFSGYSRRGLILVPGTTFNKNNVAGISCISHNHQEILPNKNISDAENGIPVDITKQIQSINFTNIFKASEFYNYFNDGFKNSSFFRYMESFKSLSSIKEKPTETLNYSNIEKLNSLPKEMPNSTGSTILLMIISLCLTFLVCMLGYFIYLVKFQERIPVLNNNSCRSYTQMNLLSAENDNNMAI